MKSLTIYDIKRLTKETSPEYFTLKTMKFFGQTLKDFRVSKQEDGRYLISAKMKDNGKVVGETKRYFNPTTNKLEGR